MFLFVRYLTNGACTVNTGAGDVPLRSNIHVSSYVARTAKIRHVQGSKKLRALSAPGTWACEFIYTHVEFLGELKSHELLFNITSEIWNKRYILGRARGIVGLLSEM